MLDCHPQHPNYPDRLRTARALKDRLVAALATRRCPAFGDLIDASLFLATVECTGPEAQGTELWTVYLLVKTVLPAADAAFDRAHPTAPRPEDTAPSSTGEKS